MSLVVMGANFKTMTLEELERISVPSDQIEESLASLTSSDGVKGAVILSTCNRVEVYVDARTDRIGVDACRQFIEGRAVASGQPVSEESQQVYFERGEAVPRHLFRVACSLDSQILGEAQILAQVKTAFMRSSDAGACSEVLTHLFKDALNVGKRVRTETAIGKDSVSLSTAAFQLTKREFADLTSCRVMFVGAGEMMRLTLPYLREAGVEKYLVTSRTIESAREFATLCGGEAVAFEDCYEAIAQADIVFCATSAEEPVIEASRLAQARKSAGAAQRKLLILDEGVPRDVEQACGELDGVILHNLEDIGQVVDEGTANRVAAIGAVERLVLEAERDFLAWMQQRSVTPTIRDMYAKGKVAVEAELVRAVKSLSAQRGEELDEAELKILEAYGNAVMKKILHGPTARLRKESETADSYYYTGAARYLFGLETFPPERVSRAWNDEVCPHGDTCVGELDS